MAMFPAEMALTLDLLHHLRTHLTTLSNEQLLFIIVCAEAEADIGPYRICCHPRKRGRSVA